MKLYLVEYGASYYDNGNSYVVVHKSLRNARKHQEELIEYSRILKAECTVVKDKK